ncbi:MAG: hypothetical protein F6K37_36625 [Moorea sp. SIO4E2]|uniref:hypothetical protein n=1 Tax=Moorena sp. SIO4E2 TaxID=2607826 RepID=UPI0013B8CBC5|nr:hypothetical protein [Moorena sp. SIO4E2]NEQ11231.1 hypothetical protein [Moorena sp. SIO4E2]
MEEKFNTIDPTQGNLPKTAVINKVNSEDDRLPEEEHEKAVKAFFVSDGIASGIGKDLAFVDKIPQFLNEIIENKSWECLYVAKGVVTPYYCCYIQGTDSENFQEFITAKRPNGLETSVETLDRVLQADLEVQRKFRTIIYQAAEPQRDEYGKYKLIPTHSDYGSVKSAQQERIRAANRAAEAIPEIGYLLDRGLIAIDVAAKLGRNIKDPNHLTAEEREYLDKRDLVGVRLRQYIYTNPIPEDEDKEPAYSRELNRFVKDLLGVKDRSKSVRMDHPKKAAEKLLQFYQNEKLKELIDYLSEKLEPPFDETEQLVDNHNNSTDNTSSNTSNTDSSSQENLKSHTLSVSNGSAAVGVDTTNQQQPLPQEKPSNDVNANDTDPSQQGERIDLVNGTSGGDRRKSDLTERQPTEEHFPQPLPQDMYLTLDELAQRLKRSKETVRSAIYKKRENFSAWTQNLDPEGITCGLFFRLQKLTYKLHELLSA